MLELLKRNRDLQKVARPKFEVCAEIVAGSLLPECFEPLLIALAIYP